MSNSYIAECPDCKSRLSLIPDHFERAQGKVQCGNCQKVFYAPDNLLKGFWPTHEEPADNENVFQDEDHLSSSSEEENKENEFLPFNFGREDEDQDQEKHDDHVLEKDDDYLSVSEDESYDESYFDADPLLGGEEEEITVSKKYTRNRPQLPYGMMVFSVFALLLLASQSLIAFRDEAPSLYVAFCKLAFCSTDKEVDATSMAINNVRVEISEEDKATVFWQTQNLTQQSQFYPALSLVLLDDGVELERNILTSKQYLDYSQSTELGSLQQQINFVDIEIPSQRDVPLELVVDYLGY